MTPRLITETTRRYQSPFAINRRIIRAYDAMARRADLAEARSNGGWFGMCGGPAYKRWMRAKAHALVCRQLVVRPVEIATERLTERAA